MLEQIEENDIIEEGKLLSVNSKSNTSSANYSQESNESEEHSFEDSCKYQHKNTAQGSHSVIFAEVIPKTKISINTILGSDDLKASEVCSKGLHKETLRDAQIDTKCCNRKTYKEELESSKGCHKWICYQEINKSGKSLVQSSRSSNFESNEKESDLAHFNQFGPIDSNRCAISQSDNHKIFKVEHINNKMKKERKREAKLKRKFENTQFDDQSIRSSIINMPNKCPTALQENSLLHPSEIQYDQTQIGFSNAQLNNEEALHCDNFLECIDDTSEYQNDILSSKMFATNKSKQLSSYMNDSIYQRVHYHYPMCFNHFEDQGNQYSNEQISNLSSPQPIIHPNFDSKCRTFHGDLFDRNQN